MRTIPMEVEPSIGMHRVHTLQDYTGLMIDTPSKTEWVIGLHSHPQSPPGNEIFLRFYSKVIRLLEQLGVPIPHVAAEGDGFSGKLVKLNSAAGNRIIRSGFEGISGLSFVVSPQGSMEPAYDRVLSASLSWNAPAELLLCVVVNESIVSFLSETFETAILEFIGIENWSYGYSFRDAVTRQPDFHVLSLDNGQLSKVETQFLRKWYSSTVPERLQRLRSIYPITIANERQLACNVDGISLGEFMQLAPGTTLNRIGDLFLWRVPESQVIQFRESLGVAGVLIA
ncbi:hypothetical protein K2Y11_11405 [bacterium]|nr:hypothetical protein [bacterium]